MKILKTFLFAVVATCFFASANAQVRVQIGHPVHHRRVVVVHHPVHHYHHRHIVVRHR